jgi:hypothetical protein
MLNVVKEKMMKTEIMEKQGWAMTAGTGCYELSDGFYSFEGQHLDAPAGVPSGSTRENLVPSLDVRAVIGGVVWVR